MLTWADCGGTSTCYETLVEAFGEDIAKTIPYLYNVDFDEKWMGSSLSSFNIYAFVFDWNLWTSYTQEYGELLLANGYTLLENSPEDYADGTTYVNTETAYILRF